MFKQWFFEWRQRNLKKRQGWKQVVLLGKKTWVRNSRRKSIKR